MDCYHGFFYLPFLNLGWAFFAIFIPGLSLLSWGLAREIEVSEDAPTRALIAASLGVWFNAALFLVCYLLVIDFTRPEAFIVLCGIQKIPVQVWIVNVNARMWP